jgi:hypothetical protein
MKLFFLIMRKVALVLLGKLSTESCAASTTAHFAIAEGCAYNGAGDTLSQ